MKTPVWVLDTNVLVSALWSDRGPPALLWHACRAGRFLLAYDPATLGEYKEVLHRPEFGFFPAAVADILGVILHYGVLVATPPLVPGVLGLPDPDDEMFLAVALSAPDHVLVTGNARHFPARFRCGVAVLSPREALARLPV